MKLAAGNKAAINLIEKGIVDKDHVKLLNTTSKDLPDDYKIDSDLFIPFSSGMGGCGKESAKGRMAMIEAIQNKTVNFANLLNDDSKEVILVSSMEGGTGSGSVPVIAKYFEAMNIPVHVFGFIGFQDEARGINNTLKFFKDLPSKVILHTIVNSFFLDYTKNYGKAEMAANDEFAKQIEILLGHKLIPSKHNIDDTDLYKINIQEGYMIINHIELDNPKNIDAVNSAISAVFENPCYMDCDTSAKRIAVAINASSKTQQVIDNSYEVIKRYVGTPIELYQHIQPDIDDELVDGEYMDIIACGMNFPDKPIKDVSVKYNRLKDKLNTSRKSFADIFGEIDVEDEVDEFNMDIKTKLDQSAADELFAKEMNLGNKSIKKSVVEVPKQVNIETSKTPNTKNNETIEQQVTNTPKEAPKQQHKKIFSDDEYETGYQNIDVVDIPNPMQYENGTLSKVRDM